jgi:hypothetical protein
MIASTSTALGAHVERGQRPVDVHEALLGYLHAVVRPQVVDRAARQTLPRPQLAKAGRQLFEGTRPIDNM